MSASSLPKSPYLPPDPLSKLIEQIARHLVDNPEAVKVTARFGENTTVIELTVSKQDIGKIIGKRGRMAQSIRTLLSCASTKLRKRAVLEIIE